MRKQWAVLGAATLFGCAASALTTIPEAATHLDRRYEVRTRSEMLVVDSIRVAGDTLTAVRPAIRPGDPGTEVRFASSEVLSLRETHPDQAGLGLTAAVMALFIVPVLWFLTHYGSD